MCCFSSVFSLFHAHKLGYSPSTHGGSQCPTCPTFRFLSSPVTEDVGAIRMDSDFVLADLTGESSPMPSSSSLKC